MPGSVFEVVTLYLKNTSVKHKLARAQSGREDTSVMTDKQVLFTITIPVEHLRNPAPRPHMHMGQEI